MILQLRPDIEEAVKPLLETLSRNRVVHHYMQGKHVLVVSNQADEKIFEPFQNLIERQVHVDTSYQLASRKWKEKTTFDVKGVRIGEGHFNLIAGPCSIESEEQIFTTAAFLATNEIRFIRGGAHKPRTSPYSFRGLGRKGLQWIREAANKHDLRVVTEILDLSFLDDVYEHADILQVGSRNMQNFHLLKELGKINKPVLLKRGMNAKVNEWLLAAEYILSGGNEQVILCERGIRSFDPETRNVMDIGIIPLMKELSHLPVIADPSHGTGASSRVIPLSLAAIAAGADGILVEIHPEPSKALSDSQQALNFEMFGTLLEQSKPILHHLGRIADFEISPLKLQPIS